MIRKARRLLAVALLPAACGVAVPDDETGPEPPPDADRATPLQVFDREVRDAEGRVLVDVRDLPDRIPAEEDAVFGVEGAMVDAALSPDGEWLAVARAGTAHGGGWLVSLTEGEAYPAAFQYGGGVEVGPWSEDGRYVVFVLESPAPGRTLSVVDRQELGATVIANAMRVEVPGDEELDPAAASQEPLGWSDGQLLFERAGERFRFDPGTGTVTGNREPGER